MGAGLVINQCGLGWVRWLFPGWWVRLVLMIGVFADLNNSGLQMGIYECVSIEGVRVDMPVC